jgi:hypothetical protein
MTHSPSLGQRQVPLRPEPSLGTRRVVKRRLEPTLEMPPDQQQASRNTNQRTAKSCARKQNAPAARVDHVSVCQAGTEFPILESRTCCSPRRNRQINRLLLINRSRMDAMSGPQIGTECPILHAEQDQVYRIDTKPEPRPVPISGSHQRNHDWNMDSIHVWMSNRNKGPILRAE